MPVVFPAHSAAASPIAPAIRRTLSIPGVARLLIVDDDAVIRRTLARSLRECGYDVHECESGPAALDLLRDEPFVVILCEVRVHDMSGLDLVARAVEVDRDLALIVLTAVHDTRTAKEALARGALDYLVKPIAVTDVHRAVERAIHRRQLEIDRRTVERHIREDVMLHTIELEREKAALHALSIGIGETLINAMEAKDVYLRGHSRRVAEQAASVADELGLDADVVENVRLAGRLHDIGKIGIREDVLNSSLGGRILAACDAFDAMTSRRAYREAFDEKQVIEHLRAEVGRLLDPAVFAALERVVVRRKTLTFIDDRHA